MKKISQNQNICTSHPLEISDDDIIEAMKDIQGYLDITPGDFKVLYRLAYKHAIERLSQLIKACDVMTERVISVKRDTPSEEVAYTMATHGVSGVPVVESENKVIGVISEKDFLFDMGSKDTTSFMEVVAHCLSNKECVGISMRRQKAEQIMTSPAITVPKDESVSKIAILFTKKNINRVPVTDREGKLLGIVARADIVQSSYIPVIKTDDEK
jgi:CBS-domain-containing membrane protein